MPDRLARTALFAAVFAAPAALAHTGHGEAHDFLHGLLHPLSGLDHVLAMIAVGMLAWKRGGHARWLLPGSFLAMLALGMVLGLSGFVLPHVETAVAASVAAMGFLLLAHRRLPAALALPLVGIFCVFHGNAHGAEMQLASLAIQGTGFVLGTASLHAVGLAVGRAFTALLAPRRTAARTSREAPVHAYRDPGLRESRRA